MDDYNIETGGGSGSSGRHYGTPDSQSHRTGRFAISNNLVSTSPKTLFIIVVYMFLLTTSSMVFQNAYASIIVGDHDLDMNLALSGNSMQGDGVFSAIPRSIASHELYDIMEYAEYGAEIYDASNFNVQDIDYFTRVYADDNGDGEFDIVAWFHDATKDLMVGFRYVPGLNTLTSNLYVITTGVFDLLFADQKYDTFEGFMEGVGSNLGVDITDSNSWWNRLGGLWEGFVNTFQMIGNFLLFKFVPSIAIPDYLVWIPFMMALPVYIYVSLLLLPIIIEILKVVAQVLNAFIPF